MKPRAQQAYEAFHADTQTNVPWCALSDDSQLAWRRVAGELVKAERDAVVKYLYFRNRRFEAEEITACEHLKPLVPVTE